MIGDAHGVHRGETHLAVAEEHERADVALAELVAPDGVEAGLVDRRRRKRNRHLEDVRRREEPAGVLVQAEDGGAAVLRLVAADPLERTEPVVQRVREDVDVGLVPRDERAIEPD